MAEENVEASVEVRAKEMGWSPKEEFRGDPAKWTDAEEYVRRGEELMPILRANNRKLHSEVSTLKSEIAETKQLLANAKESIDALKEFTSKETLKEAKAIRKDLTTALHEAREDKDVDKELEIQDKLAQQNEAIRVAEAPKPPEPKPPEPPPADPTKTAEFIAWKKENPWFGEDKRRSSLAIAIGNELRADNPSLTGRALLDRVADEVEKTMPSRSNGASKVEEGGRSTGGGSGGKSYADLPADAKSACESDAKRLVGPGRAYKDVTEWRKAYANKYFQE